MSHKTKSKLRSVYRKFRPAMVQALENSPFKISREGISKISSHEITYDEQESYTLSEPEGKRPLPTQLDNACGKFQLPQPSVHELQDITLVGPDAIPVASYNRYVLPEFAGNTREVINSMMRSLYEGVIPVRLPASISSHSPTISLTGRGSCAYFHWCSDYLPRLQAAEVYADSTGKFPDVLIPPNPPSFVTESLNYMNVPDSNIIPWDADQMSVSTLLLPLSRHDSPKNLNCDRYSPRALQWVGDTILSNVNVSETESKRIFVTRRGAPTRRIVNEDEVIDVLSDFNIQPVNLSQMSLRRQIQLFHNSEVVVAPHGAGLINIIYADKLKILEIFGKKVIPIYYMLSTALGLDYRYMQSLNIQPTHEDLQGDNIIIDKTRFRRTLSAML